MNEDQDSRFIPDAAYWNKRYLAGDTGWDIGYPAPFLVNSSRLWKKEERILIPGAGNAHEAIYLWQQGFTRVFVLDYAAFPLNRFRQNYPDFPREHLLQADFFQFQPEQGFDRIVEQTFFCAIHPSLRREYVRQMWRLLLPDGYLGGVLFNDALNSDKPPYGGLKAEYLDLFQGPFTCLHLEEAVDSIAPRKGRELAFLLQKKNSYDINQF